MTDPETTAGVWSVGDRGLAADVEGAPAMVAVVHQPDSVVDAGEVGDLHVRLASVRGAGHRYDGTVRQDDVGLAVAGDGAWLVIAVADGVSAGTRSHLAARASVRAGVRMVADALDAGTAPDEVDWEELVGGLAAPVRLVARRALEAREAARTMASTVALATVATAADPDGTRPAVVLPVGDTSAWIRRAAGTWEPVTPVKNDGEAVASSATVALPLLPATIVAASVTLQPADTLAVLTDGIGDPLGDGTGEVATTLAGWWATPPNRWAFAAQVDFGRRSHTDDRTAVVVWTPAPVSAEAEPSATEPSATEPGAPAPSGEPASGPPGDPG
jgi:serine/threonine protein phosphatase PrpC